MPKPPITREAVYAILGDNRPRRICFKTTHAHEPKRSNRPHIGSFNVPFYESIGPIFESDLPLKLFKNPNRPGFWRSIRSEEEFKQIKDWVERQRSRVFLRDCLDISLALGVNFEEVPCGSLRYTWLGAAEARAKEKPDDEAIRALVSEFVRTIRELPYYRDAKLIAAIPPRPEKDYDLPSELASRIASELCLQNLTPRFRFEQSRQAVKGLSMDEKWDAWEGSGLMFDGALTGRPSVILVDDKYQSGISIQFVASVLQKVGAGEIYGLCAVKTWKDTDNV